MLLNQLRRSIWPSRLLIVIVIRRGIKIVKCHKRAFNLCLSLIMLVIYVIRRLRVLLMSLNVSTNSSCSMQMDCSRCLSQEGVDLCAQEINQSGTGMLIDCCKPDDDSENHCLRPESLINSPIIQINFFNKKSNMTTPTINNQTHTDSNTNMTQPGSMTRLQSTAEQARLQTFVETFPVSSPNFRRQVRGRTYDPANLPACPDWTRFDNIKEHGNGPLIPLCRYKNCY